MFGRRDTEVLVAGAGPVGLYAALLLSERGIRVHVVDEQFRSTTRSYALALHSRSLELFDEIGLTHELLAQGRRLDAVAFHGQGRKQAEVRFSQLGSRYPFVLVLPQSALEAALERRLAAKKVEIDWSHRLSDLELGEASVTASVQKLSKDSVGYAISHTEWMVESESTVRAAFILGTDGHQSRVRRELGIPFDPSAAPQFFAVFEFTADQEASDQLDVCLDERTSVLWPLQGNRYRWSFEIGEDEAAETAREKSRLVVVLGQQSFNYLDPSMLRRLIGERAPWFEPHVHEVAWSLAARFERRSAAELGRGAAWLAGDSAHLAPPMAVQSMNSGFWEARELVERITATLRTGGRRDELARYGQDWWREWQRVVNPSLCVEVTDSASSFVRANAARIVDCLPASGEHLGSLLGQLGLRSKG